MECTNRIIVRCPFCGQRVLDKISLTTGQIELKCPRCHQIVKIDLSLRRGRVAYRRNNTLQGSYSRL